MMSWKRKAEQELPANDAKRNGHQAQAVPPKSARSAFAARQGPSQTVRDDENTPSKPDASKPVSTSAIASASLRRYFQNSTSGEEPTKASSGPASYTATLPQIFEASSSSEDDDDEDGEDDGDSELSETATDKPLTEAQYPRTWKRARELITSEILAQPRSGIRIQITGTANTGKAIFHQYLIDTLLQPPAELGFTSLKSVARLDLDPTFGFPGHLTLTLVSVDHSSSPPTEKTTEIRSIPVGLCGQKEDAHHFLSAAKELLCTFQQLHSTMALLIICPSFQREAESGMDGRATQKLMNLLRAEHICCMGLRSSQAAEVVETVRQAGGGIGTFWDLEALPESHFVRDEQVGTTVTQRYFHSRISIHGTRARDDLPISHRKPYGIRYSEIDHKHKKDINGVFILGDLPPNHPFMVSRVLNGSIVAIMIYDDEKHANVITASESDKIPYFTSLDGGNPDPTVLLQGNSIGLGLVRNIDHERGVIYIVTPEHVTRQIEALSAENIVLVHGVADSPGWAYREDLEAGQEPCYLGRVRKGMQILKSRRFKKKV
jgi:hypothetical protein